MYLSTKIGLADLIKVKPISFMDKVSEFSLIREDKLSLLTTLIFTWVSLVACRRMYFLEVFRSLESNHAIFALNSLFRLGKSSGETATSPLATSTSLSNQNVTH